MKLVVLVFPSINLLTNFIIGHEVSNAEVDTLKKQITAKLSEAKIVTAILNYQAELLQLKGAA